MNQYATLPGAYDRHLEKAGDHLRAGRLPEFQDELGLASSHTTSIVTIARLNTLYAQANILSGRHQQSERDASDAVGGMEQFAKWKSAAADAEARGDAGENSGG